MTLPIVQRTLSDPEIERPRGMNRKKSLFNLRKEPLTPQVERKHVFRKRSNTRAADEQLLIELSHQTRLILHHHKLQTKEKELIEQILKVANTPDNLLILLRQLIKDPALRELLAPDESFKKLQGLPEILILPAPDVKGFSIAECSRLFVFDQGNPLNVSINGKKVDFVFCDAEFALLHFLQEAENAGWAFQEDEKEHSVIEILNNRKTRFTKLLQAACMHAPGDAIALLRTPLSKLAFTRINSFPIECFIHSDQRFCVIHRIQYRIEQHTELLLSASITYDHGDWTSALYLTNIKGEPLKEIDELKKMREQQQEPASVEHLFAKHAPDLPDLDQAKKRLQSILHCPSLIQEVQSLEELYVVNQTFVHNRPVHQHIALEVSKEHVRALSTFKQRLHHIGVHEKGPVAAAMEYLQSERMFTPLQERLIQPLEHIYSTELTPFTERILTYRIEDDHFTLVISDHLSFYRKGKIAWSCNRHGAITFLHGQMQAYILLTDISPFKHHYEKQHLEPYLKKYEKACIPAFYKKSS
jgi:hypothetical protein